MTGRFEFATAGRIVFGRGAITEAAAAARELGWRAMLVRGRSAERTERVRALLPECMELAVDGEPTVELAREGAARAREWKADVVVAIGGGSVLDAGKAIAALAANACDVLDYLEVIGRGAALEREPLPVVAAPTTAGTGSEVTRNAVLGSREHGVKASLRHAKMLPRAAVVDPEMTVGLPPAVTAATGLDALTQLIEPYLSGRANAMTDALCRYAIPLAARALPRAYHQPNDLEARSAMSLASLYGGLALANAGLGAVHGCAAPIGGRFAAPHGAVCAALLPFSLRVNRRALEGRAPSHPAVERLNEVAVWLTGRSGVTAEAGIEWLEQLLDELRIPALRTYGIGREDLPQLAADARRASSMKANPIVLEESEVLELLEKGWGRA